MGSLISRARLVLRATEQLVKGTNIIYKRLQTSPGLPVSNPTLPLWMVPGAAIPHERPNTLPDGVADIIVIGSGITGTSVAYTALSRESGLKIVMLEARDVCSGATGRNGGHVNPPLHHDYGELEEKYGKDTARAVIAFRLAHWKEMQSVASREDILKESQCRETEHLDVYTCADAFATAKKGLARWREDMPVEADGFVCYEREEAIDKFRLGEQVVGCIANVGGAIHPYRFVTSLLAILLSRHADNFQIFPHTPCTAISTEPDLYAVHTPLGTLRTKHVVHATNGWCAHLLRPLLTKIMPALGNMSAQRPGSALDASTHSGLRSFVFFRGRGKFEYLTQLPSGKHELMFGGGWGMVSDYTDVEGISDFGYADDGVVSHVSQSYLAGALPGYFGLRNWGADAGPSSSEAAGWGLGRTKAQWSGIFGMSADMMPWVGRLPEKVCGRATPGLRRPKNPRKHEKEVKAQTATPGEWIAAGYSGEGMTLAWMSGKALACMVMDAEEEVKGWFPEVLRVTEKRWKEANPEEALAQYS